MSRATIVGVVPDRRPVTLLELPNAWGWAPSIWDRLTGRRLSTAADGPVLDRLWKGIEDDPPWRQIPNVLTFDTGVIPFGAFLEAADELDEFERRLPAPAGHVNHVPAVADLLRTQPEVPLIGVWGTSVTENPFDPWDTEADDYGNGLPASKLYMLPRHRPLAPPSRGGHGEGERP